MTKMQVISGPDTGAGPSLAEAIERVAGRLAAAGIPRAPFEARLLLGQGTGLSRARLLAESARPLTRDEEERLENLVARRVAREPMALILGTREFWSLDFAVSSTTLIPRPESETLIETALALVTDHKAALRVLDLGTGTGCLLLALLSELPHSSGLGIDKSEAACGVARENGGHLGLGGRALFSALDWSEAGFGDAVRRAAVASDGDDAGRRGGFDLLLANPPYIPEGIIDTLEPEVRLFEPRAALSGGADGLDAYRLLARHAAGLLAPGGRALFEIGQGQGQDVTALMEAAGLGLCGRRSDLAGIERCLVFATA